MRLSGASKKLRNLATIAILGIGVTACSSGPSAQQDGGPIDYKKLPGDGALGQLPQGAVVTSDDTSLMIEVTRLSCAGGVTGEVLEPAVSFTESEVVIVARVGEIEGDQTCPSNDWVPITVDLSEPIGERKLVDGECLLGDSDRISDCVDAVRWDPEAGVSERLL
jgi:hypothetical protein